MNLDGVMELYIGGFVSGILLSVLPFIIGEIIVLGLRIMKKGEA